MTIHAFFTIEGITYTFIRPLALFDRNYDDESYAYFLEPIPNAEDGLFEINVFKDLEKEGGLIADGYTSIYLDSDQSMPDRIIETVIKLDYSNI